MIKKLKIFQCRLFELPVPLKNTLKIEKAYVLRKNKTSSLTNLTSYVKIYKPVFHSVLYCIIMFMHCIYP